MSGEPRSRGPGCAAPPPRPRRLFAPPPARSRKVPKLSPNVRKRNFLFPTLERAALRWLRGHLGTLLPRRWGLGLRRVGKVGGTCRLPPHPPFLTQLFQPAVFSLRPPLPRQLAPP